MPAGALKGPDAEVIWGRAVAQADKQYPGEKSSNPDKFYAIAMTIYKAMCTKHNCSPKAEGMVALVHRLEILSEGNMARVNVQKIDIDTVKDQIMEFHRRYRGISDLLWDDSTNRNSTGYRFLKENPEIEKKWDKFRDAYNEFLKSIWNAGKYVDVRVPKTKRFESTEMNEAVTLTGVVLALDRAVERAKGLASKMHGKWLGRQRAEIRTELQKYADALLQLVKEFEE